MKLKGRTLLVLALLLFGGYAVYDYFKEQKAEEKSTEESRLMTVNYEQVDTIEIQKADSKIILKRSEKGWDLVAPIKDLADNTFADDFVKNTFPERIIEVAKEGDNIDWSLYGLDKPLGTLTLKTAGGAENVFEISDKKNFEGNVFARRNKENKVLVLNSSWQNRVFKSVNDFRDMRFLRHRIASVDELKVKNQKGLVDLKRIDGVWLSPSKKDLKLDQNKVREILSSLANAKAEEILSESEKIPKGKHLFTLDLTLDEKKWNAEVTQAQSMAIYAKISEPNFGMKMDHGALDKFINLTVESLKEAPPEKEKKNDDKNGGDVESALAEKKDK